MISREDLAEYLIEAGLEPATRGDGTWQGRSVRPGRPLVVHVRLSENWLCLAVTASPASKARLGPIEPFAGSSSVGDQAAPDGHARSSMYDRLLRANHDVGLAKFCLDEDGTVLLMVDLPTESLDPAEVREAVETLARHV